MGVYFDHYRFIRVIGLLQSAVSFPLQGKQWLDLGSNNGTFPRILCSYGLSVTGVDIFDSKFHEDKMWQYHQTDINNEPLPFDDSSFDVVSALEVLEHIIGTDRFLNEVHRVLKPGGFFVLTTPNICMLKNRIRMIFGLYPYSLEYRNIIHHVRLYNLGILKKQLKERGFSVILAEGGHLLPDRFFKYDFIKKVSDILVRFFPTLCSDLVVIAQR